MFVRYANRLWHVFYQCDLSILFLSPVAIWRREKYLVKKMHESSGRLFCHRFKRRWFFFFREILSSSHFKCSIVIAILIRDKEWMRTANQPKPKKTNNSNNTRRPCLLWLSELCCFLISIDVTFLPHNFTHSCVFYSKPSHHYRSILMSKKEIDTIIIRVNHCTCQMECGKLRVFSSKNIDLRFSFI